VKAGWKIMPLGSVCAFDKVQGIHRNLPYVGLEHIESQTARFSGSIEPQSVKSSTFRFSTEHILYGRLRPYLNKVLAPDFEGHCSTEIFPIKPGPALLREYLLYWFIADETVERINGTCTGARMPRANMQTVMGFDFPLPPLPEQRRIVGILDEAMAAIATAKANTEANLANARAVFDSRLHEVFSQRGEGWVEKRLGEVCHKITDGTHHSPKTQFPEPGPNRFPYITSKNIRNNFMDLSDVAYIERAFHDEVYARCQPSLGDVLLTKDGASTGNVTLNTLDEPFSLLSSVCLMKSNPNLLSPAFLCYFLQSSIGLSSIVGRMTGTAIKRIVLRDIKKATIPIPPLKEQDIIVAKLNALLTETQRLESIYRRKLEALEALKKSLLHAAFEGEL
jgi:type I restriction enzyme S subunit